MRSPIHQRILISLTLLIVLASTNSHAQESTIIGKVLTIDQESGVVNVARGSFTKQIFKENRLDADLIWDELIKDGYIDAEGNLQTAFYSLDKFTEMTLAHKFYSKRKLIFNIIQKAMSNAGSMSFEITLDSNLLRGTHKISTVEILAGDPVSIQYDRSADGHNTVITLVDNKTVEEQ